MQAYDNNRLPLFPDDPGYSNEQIDIRGLPQVNDVRYEGLEKPYLYVMMLGSLGALAFLAIGFFVLALSTGWWLDLTFWAIYAGTLLLLALGFLTFNYLGFRKKGYALRQRDIVYKTGLLWKKWTVVPFNRIQHCEIRKSPAEDFFELCKLKIYTAGGSGSDISVPGLKMETAARLKDFIMDKAAVDEEE